LGRAVYCKFVIISWIKLRKTGLPRKRQVRPLTPETIGGLLNRLSVRSLCIPKGHLDWFWLLWMLLQVQISSGGSSSDDGCPPLRKRPCSNCCPLTDKQHDIWNP
ncbi:hypothetical protein STEG23_036646, partial [Scotinomys teguina]